MTPHEAIYGVKPVLLNMGKLQDLLLPVAQNLLEQREQILQQLKDNLGKAQQRMKYYADQKRTERHFQEGEWVFLKLQPYRQKSVAVRTCFKLAARFYGPFQIEKKIGEVAYKLRLPDHCRIHPVFHVSLLKKYIGQTPVSSGTLPEYDQEDVMILTPEKVLQRRQVSKGNQTVVQWLIKWKDLDMTEASWEDCRVITNQFPQFKA
ncbi:hypothetical protein DCAR_0522183 [Daucus carota subsp. sativus]|uniref:Chromo domain-containing protein n=1 Tax=Daucus carota subsp. sativus TaxID=79200 RepID=A0AAF0X7G1_DAUCS|nr:hypothetical protein DCAR_0522183 [Daucus carota subsp. sativus]